MKYLSSDPDVIGGVFVIKGTRTPADVLLHHLVDGYTVEEIQAMYSWIDVPTLKGALNEFVELRAAQDKDEPTISLSRTAA